MTGRSKTRATGTAKEQVEAGVAGRRGRCGRVAGNWEEAD